MFVVRGDGGLCVILGGDGRGEGIESDDFEQLAVVVFLCMCCEGRMRVLVRRREWHVLGRNVQKKVECE